MVTPNTLIDIYLRCTILPNVYKIRTMSNFKSGSAVAVFNNLALPKSICSFAVYYSTKI